MDSSAEQEESPGMTSDAVLEFLGLMEASSLDVCLDGGWGVDALLGEQTREHGDLDVIVRVEDAPRLAAVAGAAGYARQPGGTEANFVLKTESGHAVDVHAIAFDGRGFGVFALPDGRKWPFPPSAFRGHGRIRGKEVRCLSPEAQAQCHAQGYTPDQADLQDMQLLQDRFGVVLPLALCRQPGVEDQGKETATVVRQVFAAFAAHDLNAFRSLLHPDVVLEIGGGPATVAGADAVVAAVSVTVQAIPDLRVTVRSAFAHGPLAAAEVVREGTHTGTAVLPDGTPVPPSGGRAVRLPECVVFTVRDGKVARMAAYVDMLDSLRQLGVLPAPGGGAAPDRRGGGR
jgi:lincosamide nucleotidyltransferase A/C/D/E